MTFEMSSSVSEMLEKSMAPKHRSLEPSPERKRRLEENDRKKKADAIENEAATDEMIRRNIEKHGA